MALLGCYELGSCDDPATQASELLRPLDQQTVNCDFLVAEHCLLPFPSSTFLVPDPNTPTGMRVHIEPEAMPMNRDHIRIDPADYNTFDGFSPGAVIITIFPGGVDLNASGAARITNIQRSLDSDSPTVLVDADTGQRVLHFVELDEQAFPLAFMIRPCCLRRLIAVVAISGLVDNGGERSRPADLFKSCAMT
jgi:hypothetical protein